MADYVRGDDTGARTSQDTLREELFDRIRKLPRVAYDIDALLREPDDDEERELDSWVGNRPVTRGTIRTEEIPS